MNKIIIEQINTYYKLKVPFFFMLDFKAEHGIVSPLEEIDNKEIRFHTPKLYNYTPTENNQKHLTLDIFPISYEEYKSQWNDVHQAIIDGNSYLVNLCCKTPIETNYSLQEIFDVSIAKYKLFVKDKFVHFSPETFIKISDNKIETFPMKGTINAASPAAIETLETDTKEIAEQHIITDLMRNDLSIVADDVRVERFRYLEKIHTHNSALWQVSTHISGKIKKEYEDMPGSILDKILPAGSICGAPKKKTVSLIESIEPHPRGYYTGVWGIYDGENIDSCVMIRFIEQEDNGTLSFRSGGGITALSDTVSEYKEIIDKIYVPIH